LLWDIPSDFVDDWEYDLDTPLAEYNPAEDDVSDEELSRLMGIKKGNNDG
jgi:hypothetical protein